MVTEGGRGLLIDWDLSKNFLIDPEAVIPAERTVRVNLLYLTER